MSEPIGKAVSFDRKRLQHDIAVARDNISGTQGHAGHVGHIVFFWVNFVSGSQGHAGHVGHIVFLFLGHMVTLVTLCFFLGKHFFWVTGSRWSHCFFCC